MSKLKNLKKLFKIYKIDGYFIPKNDEFFGEYIPEFKDNLRFISNFSGSYGFALILKKKTTYLLMVVIRFRQESKVVQTLKLLLYQKKFLQMYWLVKKSQ